MLADPLPVVVVGRGLEVDLWLFSQPRFLGTHVTDGLPCQQFEIPVGSPADGLGAVPAGAHTLQLGVPTAGGVQAINVGVTLGGPVPSVVPSGEGPAPLGAGLVMLVALAGVVLTGRRLVTQAG